MAGTKDQDTRTIVSNGASGTATATARSRAGDAVIGMTIKERYLIEKELGTGGFGAVYLAHDQELLSRRVVIKLLHEKSLQNEWAVRKFRQEMEALTRIEHPGVVGVLDTGNMPDGVPFIVMEYVEGVSLRSLMKLSPEGMGLEHAADLVYQIGHALNAAHEKGIIHRDLKPENIMVRSLSGGDEQVKIIDFGVAKVKDSRVAPSTVIASTAGTIAYMSPEQLNARLVSGSADTYSLGVIAYEMLTGRRPFNPETGFQLAEMQRDGVRIKPSDLRPALSTAVDDIILKALSYGHRERFASARIFADYLTDALVESDASESPQVGSNAETITMSKFEEAHPPKGKYWLIVAGLVLLGVIVAGVLVWPRTRSSTSGVQPVSDPAKTSAVATRTIDYYLMVQKYLPNGKAYQEPFKATGNDILGDGWHFSIHTSSPQDGFLYLINEGPAAGGVSYNLLFPTPKFNGGSAQVAAGQDRDIGPYELDAHQGTEKFWLVWSVAPVAELEAVKSVVNPKDKGTVSDPQRIEAIRNFLGTHWASKPDVTIDKPNSLVHVKAKSDPLVNLMELEHH